MLNFSKSQLLFESNYTKNVIAFLPFPMGHYNSRNNSFLNIT